MNTSTNTNQIHHILRRGIAGALLAMAITATAVGLAATSHADFGDPTPDFAHSARPDAICKTEPWGFLGSQRRALCDGPVAKDASWTREHTIWVPAHRTVESCNYGSNYHSFSFCTGGYWVDQKLVSNETYPVRPQNGAARRTRACGLAQAANRDVAIRPRPFTFRAEGRVQGCRRGLCGRISAGAA